MGGQARDVGQLFQLGHLAQVQGGQPREQFAAFEQLGQQRRQGGGVNIQPFEVGRFVHGFEKLPDERICTSQRYKR